MLFVSTTSRETRPSGDETIGIHRDRRQPSSLGRGNPARLVLGGKETGDVDRDDAGPLEEPPASEEERARPDEE